MLDVKEKGSISESLVPTKKYKFPQVVVFLKQ